MSLNTSQFQIDCQPMSPAQGLTLPAYFYLMSEIQALENLLIIERNWQCVGHISQLEKPGDHIVADVNEKPVIVVKTKQDILKGFMNVCRHRGGPLATCNGHSNMLTCKYHGWTYSLDGQLKAAPEMSCTQNFSVKDYQLPEIHLDIWQGLVFVCVAKVRPQALELQLDGIAATIEPIDLSTMQFSHRDEYIIQCNWKVYMDNYLEGYHIPHIHPELNKILDYRSYQTHCYERYSYQFSPLETVNTGNNVYGDGQAHYYTLFPNIMLNILPNRLQTNVVIPLGENRCKVIFDYYYAELNSTNTQALIASDKAFSDEVQKEDIDICERVQKGLASGTYQQGRLCMKRETGVLHFQNLLRNDLLGA